MPRVRTRVIVSGVVQGVFFRDATRRMAQSEGLAGWVRNRADGSVEAVFEGEPEAVAAAVRWSRVGPQRAVVESLSEFAETPEGLLGFEVRYD